MMPPETRPRSPLLLLILDGFGAAPPAPDNAISQAQMPNWSRLSQEFPHTLVHTSGRHVGLPDGQMGNSEVGHMNLGAGRVVWQELTRIDAAIDDGSLAEAPALVDLLAKLKASGGRLHLIGLLSPGGVHSHEAHLYALLAAASAAGIHDIVVHALLDGRDTPPRSAAASLESLLERLWSTPGNARIATVGGRYFAMDRDHRWPRVERAYQAIVGAQSAHRAESAQAALQAAYARGESDEFVAPTVIGEGAAISDGDAVLIFNFRADRARQLTRALVDSAFSDFERAALPKLAGIATMTQYDEQFAVPALFAPQTLADTLPEIVSDAGLSQLRIAETEKYAHVTFFFNGGRELMFPGESRQLIPSPQVATYDLAPWMSCPEVTAALTDAIRNRRFDLIICNLANADMVGHTGNIDAAVVAVETLDAALGEIVAALDEVGGELVVTADHGNVEKMRDTVSGQPHTAHTDGPVPLVYRGRQATLRDGGSLCDVAPTLLELLGLPIPPAMTGRSLVCLASASTGAS